VDEGGRRLLPGPTPPKLTTIEKMRAYKKPGSTEQFRVKKERESRGKAGEKESSADHPV